jgi:predicted membrane protein
LVLVYHGGMFDHNTRRVLLSFRIVFLTFDLCFSQVTSDSPKGATVMIIRTIVLFKRVLLLHVVLLTLFQVTSDNPEEVIVTVA